MTGAEIEQAVIDAMYTSFDNGCKVDSLALITAITESVPVSKTMGDKINKLRSWATDRCRMASGTTETTTKKKEKEHARRSIK